MKTPCEMMIESETREIVNHLLDLFPDSEKLLVEMIMMDGFTVAETSRITGIPYSTVSASIRRFTWKMQKFPYRKLLELITDSMDIVKRKYLTRSEKGHTKELNLCQSTQIRRIRKGDCYLHQRGRFYVTSVRRYVGGYMDVQLVGDRETWTGESGNLTDAGFVYCDRRKLR